MVTMNTCPSSTTTTTTAPRTKRCRDDAHVPSLTEESPCGERNKRVRPNSKQNEPLVSFADIPDAAYQPIWSFLLDSTIGRASSLDFKDIRSFMLVNKTSKGAFDDCRGWWFCAQALRREAEVKQLIMDRFFQRTIDLMCSSLLIFGNRSLLLHPSVRAEVGEALETNTRIMSIQETFFPHVRGLAIFFHRSRIEELYMRGYACQESFIRRVKRHIIEELDESELGVSEVDESELVESEVDESELAEIELNESELSLLLSL